MTTTIPTCCLIGLSALIAEFGAAADLSNDASDLETIVVTASRLSVDKREAGTSVDVIDKLQIDTRGASNIADLVRQLPGVRVAQQGGRGGVSDIYVRSGESNFTVVMFDGVKVNDSVNQRGAGYNFSNLAPQTVSRVELVRGPLSSVYGSDALAGVLQFFSDRQGPGKSLSLQAGSDDYFSVAAALATVSEASRASGTVHWSRDNPDIDGSRYEDRGLTGTVLIDLGTRTKLSVAGRYHESDSTSFPEASGGPGLAIIRDLDTRESGESHLRLALRHLADGFDIDLALSSYQRDEDFRSPGIAEGVLAGVPPNSSTSEFVREQLTAILRKPVGDALLLAAGIEWQHETGDSNGELDLGFPLPTDFAVQRDTISTFAETRVRIGVLTAHASMRWDKIDAVGSETTANLGVVYTFDGGRTRLRANWGQGFKAPGFSALANPLIGNPHLRPELAQNAELSLSRSIGADDGQIALTAYRSDYTDLIDLDLIAFMTVNRDHVVVTGVELSGDWPLSESTNMRAFATYADSDIRGIEADLRSRPNWRVGIVVDWQINDNLKISANALAVDRIPESSIPTSTVLLDAYERIDVTATLRSSDTLSWYFSVDNLLNESYEEAVGFPASRARVRVGVRYGY